jgi:hypothetical protein
LILGALAAAAASSSTLSDVEPGLLGFLVVAGMGVALVFLLRSMNKQFRKIGPPPGEDDAQEATSQDAATQDATASAEDPADAPR